MNSKKLTVGFFSPGWPLSNYPNGIVSYVENIISGFDKHSVDAVVLANSIAVDYKNGEVINVSKFADNQLGDRIIDAVLYRTSVSDALRSKIGRGVVRAVIASELPLDILEMEESFGASGLDVSKLTIPVVTRLHGPWFIVGDMLGVPKDRAFYRRIKLEGQSIVNATAVTAPSQSVLDQVRDFYSIDLPQAKVIPNPAPSVVEITKKWSLENCHNKTLLFVGRFDAVKGGDFALQAFRRLAIKDKDIQLNFVGPDRGIAYEGKHVNFKQFVEQIIPEKDIKSRVLFLGQLTTEEINKHRVTARVTIVSSRYESFSMTLLEALSLGCPTVAMPVGGITELITDGVNGLLADQVSAEALAEKVYLLINDSALMQSLSQNALEDCTKKYHPTVVAKQTLEFYKSVISNKL